jgi:hypothetical protein
MNADVRIPDAEDNGGVGEDMTLELGLTSRRKTAHTGPRKSAAVGQ